MDYNQTTSVQLESYLYISTNLRLLSVVAAASSIWGLLPGPVHKFPPRWSCPARASGRALVCQQHCRQWEGQVVEAGTDQTGALATLGAVSRLLRRGEGPEE